MVYPIYWGKERICMKSERGMCDFAFAYIFIVLKETRYNLQAGLDWGQGWKSGWSINPSCLQLCMCLCVMILRCIQHRQGIGPSAPRFDMHLKFWSTRMPVSQVLKLQPRYHMRPRFRWVFGKCIKIRRKGSYFSPCIKFFCDYVAYFGLIGYVGQIIESAEQMI